MPQVKKNSIAPTWLDHALDYERRSDCRLDRHAPGFRRRAEYRHRTDASAPVLDLLYDPAGPFHPRFRLSFRATANLSKLLDLNVVAPVLAFLSHYAQTPFRLAELELTLDFRPERGPELRQAYVPRSRTRNERGDWWVIGSRKFGFSIRGYEKNASGVSVARIELVLRRDALRSLGADTLTDLSALDWPELVTERLRLVEFDPHARCEATTRAELKSSLAAVGVSAALRKLPKARREWLRRHLVPSPIQSEVSNLVRSLDTHADCITTASTPATRKAALKADNQRRLDVAAGHSPTFKTFGDLVQAYLAEKARTSSTAWTQQVQWKLKKWCGRWATLKLEQVTPSHIAKLLQDIAASGNGPRSVNEYRRILHAVFNYAVNMEALMRNPVKKIARVGEPEEPIRPIPTADLQKLLVSADPPLRHQLTVQAMTGARWIETARLARGDLFLDQSPPYYLLRSRKTRGGGERIRKQHLPPAAVEALRAQMANYASTRHVFPGRRGQQRHDAAVKHLHRACDQAGIPRYGFHRIPMPARGSSTTAATRQAEIEA